MLVHPNFDPVAIHLGPIYIHWYGLMYVLGFLGVFLLGNYRIRNYASAIRGQWNSEQISDLIFYGALGAVLGGRLGYVLFYKPAEYLSDPIDILMVNQGGMSFHGGLLGVIAAIAIFARKTNRTLLEIGDFIAPLAPIGLFFGRMGNFINQELWGKTTDLPWGMVFTTADSAARHPSMLYEALLEGVVLLALLLWVGRKPTAAGVLSGLFLCGYALARIVVEFVRVPDAHLNYLLFDWVTMGHLLSLPMLMLGLFLIFGKNSHFFQK
ncbi:MAG: prolipoprotein diacylglyceryl transferase [Gammaproteobacteria bacterium]|nr:prolipoprotein diacylglyceryl transferase [Gammaproteobacteria bacterium]